MSIEENKKIARTYYDHNPDDVESILTHDFTGRTNERTWDRDSHKKTWITYQSQLTDTIHEQVVEGDWVATWFTRTGLFENKPSKYELMNFMRFVDGKIAEIREIGIG